MARFYYCCPRCNYGTTIGFVHYMGINKEGYGGMVRFACKTCLTTHAREIGPDKERLLYQKKRMQQENGQGTPWEQDEYIISKDTEFHCPVCRGTEVITDKDLAEDGSTKIICPDCKQPLTFLGKS